MANLYPKRHDVLFENAIFFFHLKLTFIFLGLLAPISVSAQQTNNAANLTNSAAPSASSSPSPSPPPAPSPPHAVDIWERLASHPDTRPHVADSGFRAAVERLRALDGQAAAREVMEDPRLAQALMAMQGGKDRLQLREEDMLQAEVGGRMKRRRPSPAAEPALPRASPGQFQEPSR